MAMATVAMVMRPMVAMLTGPIGTAIAPSNRIGIIGNSTITNAIPDRCFHTGRSGRNGRLRVIGQGAALCSFGGLLLCGLALGWDYCFDWCFIRRCLDPRVEKSLGLTQRCFFCELRGSLIYPAIRSSFRDHGDPGLLPATVDRFPHYFQGRNGNYPLSDAMHLTGMTLSHQNAPLDVKMGERAQNHKACPRLHQAPIADMRNAKDPLDDQQRMLALRTLFYDFMPLL